MAVDTPDYSILCENPQVTIEPCQSLNPATLLPEGEGGPSHDCKEILEVYASRPDLRDQPILDPYSVPYTIGTILVREGQGLSGYTVVMEEAIVEASSLPSHWSAQQVKLYALIRALQLSKGKKTNIYTESRYAFATLHVHGAYKERGLITVNRKDIKNKEEILTLLDAVWEPEGAAIIHCQGHQKKDIPQAWGNRLQVRLLNKQLRAWG